MVVVEYEYEALQEDELTLRLGDVIKNVRYIEEDGWMEGDLNGKRGLFPDNFVKEMKKDSKEVKETKNEPKEEPSVLQKRERSSGNVANLVQRMSTIGIPTGGFQPQPPQPPKRQCKVLFEYQPQNEDELELKVGDILDITEEVEEGWWSGMLNGKSGLFPSNFVKELDAMGEDADSNDTAADETDGSVVDSVTTPTSPQPASGNGAIAQPKKIRGVGFGDIFREGSVKLKVRLPSPELEEKKDKPIPSLPSAAKPAHPNTTDLQKGDGDGKSKGKTQHYCKVTFAFEATNEDELTLKEGETIHILSKDTGEPGWWRGEIGGKEGVFPDNFVVMLTEIEKEKEVSCTSGQMFHICLITHFKHVNHKPKPAAPVVPPKKPVPPPGKGRPGSLPPKRPDKPLTPSSNLKHNGEVPSIRPKSDFEPLPPTKPKTLSGDWGEKSSDTDLMSFDDLSSTSEKLSHPTANRPKMPGRRLPAQFGGGHSPNKELSVEKSFKAEEEDGAKPKLSETRKPTPTAPTSGLDAIPQSSRGQTVESDDTSAQLDELRSQMKELLLSVELLKVQQIEKTITGAKSISTLKYSNIILE
uniref:Osteoclast-stimulating factor 1 n=1 Tax=Sphaeramia orbicularis TaxID=375764 RepID=A0A673BMU8_9TELE